MRAKPIDRGGIELGVGIDPHQFLEPLAQGVGRQLRTSRIDLRKPRHAPNGIASPLKLS